MTAEEFRAELALCLAELRKQNGAPGGFVCANFDGTFTLVRADDGTIDRDYGRPETRFASRTEAAAAKREWNAENGWISLGRMYVWRTRDYLQINIDRIRDILADDYRVRMCRWRSGLRSIDDASAMRTMDEERPAP